MVFASLAVLNCLQCVFIIMYYTWIYKIDNYIQEPSDELSSFQYVFQTTNVLSFIVNFFMMIQLFSVMNSFIKIFSHHHGRTQIILTKILLVVVLAFLTIGKVCMYI